MKTHCTKCGFAIMGGDAGLVRAAADKLSAATKYPVDAHPVSGAIYPAAGAALAHLAMYASLLEGVCVVCSIAQRRRETTLRIVREVDDSDAEIGIEKWMETAR